MSIDVGNRVYIPQDDFYVEAEVIAVDNGMVATIGPPEQYWQQLPVQRRILDEEDVWESYEELPEEWQ